MENQFMKTERQQVKEELEASLKKFRDVYYGDEIEALRTKNERSNDMERSSKLSLEEQVVLSSMTGLVSGIVIEKAIEHIRDNQQKVEKGQKIYNLNTNETVSVVEDNGRGKLTVENNRGQRFETNRDETIIAPKEIEKEIEQGIGR